MDDLLELDFTAPSTTTKSVQPQGNGRTTFDYLSSARTSSPHSNLPSRSNSPFLAPTQSYIQPSVNNVALKSQTISKVASGTTNPNNGGDAFSSLFGASPNSASAGAKMSMAERLAKDNGTGNGWNAMNSSSVGSGSSRTSSPQPGKNGLVAPSRQSNSAQNNWDFDLLATAVPSPSLSTKSPSIPSKSQPSTTDFFSFDEPNASHTALEEEDFGFGPVTKKINIRDYDETEGEDFMGLLSQPVNSKSPGATLPNLPSHHQQSSSQSNSPPPHILGQIVEMGFSIQQAQSALSATVKPNGDWNVEGALEILVSRSGESEEMEESIPRERVRVEQSRSSPPPTESIRPVGRRAREAAALAAENGENLTKVYQEQATVLLNQASKIGFSVFKSANAYYKTGKATLQKALEEGIDSDGVRRMNGKDSSSSSRHQEDGRQGRPKWMTEDVMNDEEPKLKGEMERSSSNGSRKVEVVASFMDSDEEEDSVLPQRPTNGEQVDQNRLPPKQHDSLNASPPTGYRSPWKRPTSVSSNPPIASTSKSTNAPKSKPIPVSRPAPPARPIRQLVSATPTELSSSNASKIKGSELFKLGHFGEAVSTYTTAIDFLPTGHLGLIVLHNNRASARLKVGEEKGAIEDASAVVNIIIGSSNRVDFTNLEEDLEGVNLKGGLAKALVRRAKASEVEEKWNQAAEDWNCLMGGDESICKIAGGRKMISDGISRCRKMIGSDSTSTRNPTPPTRSIPSINKTSTQSTAPGEALAKLREANSVASAEDDLRFGLKDGIEAALLAWRGGKETNLRALISSLDNILWKELRWIKVGMHELISDSQLKIRYMRAISKVHPDKLKIDTTVEQRMIADGVFATLNSAWNSQRS